MVRERQGALGPLASTWPAARTTYLAVFASLLDGTVHLHPSRLLLLCHHTRLRHCHGCPRRYRGGPPRANRRQENTKGDGSSLTSYRLCFGAEREPS